VLPWLIDYINGSNVITLYVLAVLSLYFVLSIWSFIYRYFFLVNWLISENRSLESLMVRGSLDQRSVLYLCKYKSGDNNNYLNACKYKSTQKASKGDTLMSIIATTSPFLGLFGTVIGILEAFSKFGEAGKVTLNIIAPVISEALIATAVGILVATFAYTFHQILRRKAFEIMVNIEAQIDIVSHD
jgi:biopolymer transport protein ExbB/TolQ